MGVLAPRLRSSPHRRMCLQSYLQTSPPTLIFSFEWIPNVVCELAADAQSQNHTCLLSGRKVRALEEREITPSRVATTLFLQRPRMHSAQTNFELHLNNVYYIHKEDWLVGEAKM